jgi:hypothetical protein
MNNTLTKENKAMEYTRNLSEALQICLGNTDLYHGKEGALRLAREYGHGLNDSPYKDSLEALKASYSVLVVKGYFLKPPIDAKVWINEVKKTWNQQ